MTIREVSAEIRALHRRYRAREIGIAAAAAQAGLSPTSLHLRFALIDDPKRVERMRRKEWERKKRKQAQRRAALAVPSAPTTEPLTEARVREVGW